MLFTRSAWHSLAQPIQDVGQQSSTCTAPCKELVCTGARGGATLHACSRAPVVAGVQLLRHMAAHQLAGANLASQSGGPHAVHMHPKLPSNQDLSLQRITMHQLTFQQCAVTSAPRQFGSTTTTSTTFRGGAPRAPVC